MALTIAGRRLSFGWLKPPKPPEDGKMTLVDHLRELRYRLVISLVAFVIAAIICIAFEDFIEDLLLRPYLAGIAELQVQRPDLEPDLVLMGVTNPFVFTLILISVGGVILASPVWIYQIWAFVTPALVTREKKWTAIFLGTAVPLFLIGAVTGYLVVPKMVSILLSFTPEGGTVTNLIEGRGLLNMIIRLIIVFGLSYLVPLVVLFLNLVGVVKGRHLAKFRSFVIFGVFVFAALATPADPVSMLFMAIPLTIMILVVEVIAKANDRRREAKKAAEEDADPLANDKVLAALSAEDEKPAAIEAGNSDADTSGRT